MVEAQVEEQSSPAKKIKLDNVENNDDSELNEKIRQQLDYYFSDVNIIKDKFLLEEIKKDDGWVKLPVLLTFSLMKQLTKDENRIVQALKKCQSDVIELDDAKKRVRRKNELPDIEEFKKQLDLRTVHVSGFPTDYNFESLRQFSSQFGEVESLSMRRHFKTRFFKGCIHVVYKREEDAKKVLDTEVLKCKDRELRKESMEQYHKRKAEMAQKRMENRKKKKGGDSDREAGGDTKKGGEGASEKEDEEEEEADGEKKEVSDVEGKKSGDGHEDEPEEN